MITAQLAISNVHQGLNIAVLLTNALRIMTITIISF